MHYDHPDFWRVYSGGRSLNEFLVSSPVPPLRLRMDSTAGGPRREKRFACHVCSKRYTNETGYAKHVAGHEKRTVDGGLTAAISGAGMGVFNGGSSSALHSCTICTKVFTKEAYLMRHMEMKVTPSFIHLDCLLS